MRQNNENVYYAYRHRRLDTNEIFYIGIGNIKKFKRAYSKFNRNRYWNSIVKKYGYEVEIIAKNLSHEDACELEIFLIEVYGRKDLKTGTLVNLTNGGEGTFGRVMSEEQRQKLKEDRLGEKGYWYGIRGEANPNFGKPGLKGDKHPCWGNFGELNNNYGNRWTEEQKRKASESKKGINVNTPEHFKMISRINTRGGHPNAKKVLDAEIGTIYDCLMDAAEAFNINYRTLSDYLDGKYKNKTSLVWLDEDMRQKETVFKLNPYSQSRIILDTATGVYYYSIKEAASYTKFTKGCLRKMLNGGSKNKTSLIIV